MSVDQTNNNNWRCRLSGDSWRRICTNLVANALKFTSEGYVSITLRQIPARIGKAPKAVLIVEDTGCGMSNDFLANSMFRSFSQEDSFTTGVGLGMNVVSKLVREMGGNIDIQSTKSRGTKITVVVPLDLATSSDEPQQHKSLEGITIDLLGDWYTDMEYRKTGKASLRRAIKNTIEGLGMKITSHDNDPETPTLNIIFENDLTASLANVKHLAASKDGRRLSGFLGKPLVVVCKTQPSRNLETTIADFRSITQAPVEYLREPCGPASIAATIRSCLEPARSIETVTTSARSLNSQAQASPTNVDIHAPTSSLGPSHARNVKTSSMKQTNMKDIFPSATHSLPLRKNALSVMLVDDNNINLHLLDTYCRKQCHQSTSATDGLQAFESYKAASLAAHGGVAARYSIEDNTILHHPKGIQVILMDINMPIMDGFEATRRIRAFERSCEIQPALIIAMTGVGSDEARQKALESGIDLFFQKPVKLKELTKVLNERFPKEEA